MKISFRILSVLLLAALIYPIDIALCQVTDKMPPVPKWELNCGNVHGATITDMPEDGNIRSNLGEIVYDDNLSDNYKFSYDPFTPGQVRTTLWKLDIVDKKKDAKAVIKFSDAAGNDTTVTVVYSAPKLRIEPDNFSFGKVILGNNPSQQFKIYNLSNKDVLDIAKLEFKLGTQNYQISGLSSHIIQPLQFTIFTVLFDAKWEGDFRDSVAIGDTCVTFYAAYVTARVGNPKISVTDGIFGDVTLNTMQSKKIEIVNAGKTDLVISDFHGPMDPAFVIRDTINISKTQPLLLLVGQKHTFTVEFTPTQERPYTDAIVYSNDADGTDSIAVLIGRGVQAGLVANGCDWGKCRINRIGLPAGPYPPPNGEQVIKLSNTGSMKVIINDIIIEKANKDTAFLFDRNAFKNLIIPAGKDTVIPVKFKPGVVGEHELIFSYENSAGSSTKTRLYGIGTIGKARYTDANFAATSINDTGNPQSPDSPIRITNLPWQDPENSSIDVSDKITISGYQILPNGNEISDDGINYGKEGFLFDKTKLIHSRLGLVALPTTLLPDDYLEIPAIYVAQHVGKNQGKIRFLNDAENDSVTTWTGSSNDQGIKVTGATARICLGDTVIFDCTVENTGMDNSDVYSLKLNPPLPEFTFVDPALQNGFKLGKKEKKPVQIRFIPSAKGNYKISLEARNSSLDSLATGELNIDAIFYNRTSASSPDTKTILPGLRIKYIIGLNNEGDNLTLANISEFKIIINYKKEFLKVDLSMLEIGSALVNKFTIKDTQITELQDYTEELALTFKALGNNIFTEPGELVKMDFLVFLPYYDSGKPRPYNDLRTAIISHEIIPTVCSECCSEFKPANSIINLQPICALGFRQISLSLTSYALQEATPNPVGASGSTIEFSVGLKGWTELKLFNSFGELASEMVSEELSPGVYSLNLPIEYLASGIYFCRMQSGPFQKVVKVIVNK